MTPPIATPLTDELFAAVRAWQPDPPWKQVDSIKKDPAAWEREVQLICGAPGVLNTLVRRELPPSEENDAAITVFLDRVQMLACHLIITKRLIAALLTEYFELVTPVRRERILRAITSDQSELGIRSEWLQPIIKRFDFTPEFLRDWFIDILPKNGGGSGFWAVVGELVDTRPEVALAVAQLVRPERSAVERSLHVRLLGGLRFRSQVPAGVAVRLDPMLDALKAHMDPERRIDYLRTFDHALWRGDVPAEELTRLLETLAAATAGERAIGFDLAASVFSGRSAKELQIVALRWLKRFAESQCTPEQKHKVADIVWRAWKIVTPAELGFDPVSLLFAIQPVPADLPGVWRDIEHTLQEMMHAEPGRFRQAVRTLAREHWRPLQTALTDGNAMSWLLAELGQTTWVSAFVADLSSSAKTGERRLGAHLFEALKLAYSAAVAPAKFDAKSFAIWLAEFRTRNVYETIAAQLLAAARRIDHANEDMVQQFQSEVYYHCLNLPGLCLEKIRAEAAAIPLLQHVVDATDVYFRTLQGLRGSAIKAQQIPGLRRYELRKAQTDNRRIQEMVEKGSIFSQLVSKSYLLYGNQHSYIMDGKLTAPTGLHEFNNSFEMPRMEGIDPEETRMRRFRAYTVLAEMRETESEPEGST